MILGPNGQFESVETRDIAKNVSKIMEALGDLSNYHIGDIGAGTGLFSVALDEAVKPNGQVYANEISEGFLLMLREKVAKEGLTRTQIVEVRAYY